MACWRAGRRLAPNELRRAELVVAREHLRAEVDTRLARVAFGSDSDVCVDPGSLVKAAVRAVGKQVSEKKFSRQQCARG